MLLNALASHLETIGEGGSAAFRPVGELRVLVARAEALGLSSSPYRSAAWSSTWNGSAGASATTPTSRPAISCGLITSSGSPRRRKRSRRRRRGSRLGGCPASPGREPCRMLCEHREPAVARIGARRAPYETAIEALQPSSDSLSSAADWPAIRRRSPMTSE